MRQIRLIFAALFVFSPFAANGDEISYDFSGTGFGGGDSWTFEGSFFFDDASLVAGVNIFDDLLSWNVSWTNGVDMFSNSDADSIFDVAEFFLSPDLSVDAVLTTLCSNECSPGFEGVFQIEVGLHWEATLQDGFCCAEGLGSWSGPNAVSVPEPGTVALLGIGLFGMRLARRRNQA